MSISLTFSEDTYIAPTSYISLIKARTRHILVLRGSHHLTRLESCSTRERDPRDICRFSAIPILSLSLSFSCPSVLRSGSSERRREKMEESRALRAIEQHLPSSHDCLAIAVPTCFEHATQFVCVSLFYYPRGRRGAVSHSAPVAVM